MKFPLMFLGTPMITLVQNLFFLAYENKWDVPSFCFEFWPHSLVGAVAPNQYVGVADFFFAIA